MAEVTAPDWLARAELISRDVLGCWSMDVDNANRFPQESIDALRDAGLLAFCVPRRFGGAGGDFRMFCRMASMLQ